MKIDKKSNIPNFFQVVEIIEKNYIYNSGYTEETLPSLEELAGLCSVSKVTAENAVTS